MSENGEKIYRVWETGQKIIGMQEGRKEKSDVMAGPNVITDELSFANRVS
jgi:hypothetical protein